MNRINIGVLAHVDAGKTTLIEALLYKTNSIKKFGRVDNKDSFLDFNGMEREKGITINAKQARFSYQNFDFTIIDTPGHNDFFYEVLNVLSVLDYVILIVNGHNEIDVHTKSLYSMLNELNIKTIIFVNKMDSTNYSKDELLDNIKNVLNTNCYEYDDFESLALLSDSNLNEYLKNDSITNETLNKSFNKNEYTPLVFGSALKDINIDVLLNNLVNLAKPQQVKENFSAKIFSVFKENGISFANVKINGGTLKLKSVIDNEKIDQIRLYSGNKYDVVNEVGQNDVCTIKGFKNPVVGTIIGEDDTSVINNMLHTLTYEVISDKDKVLTFKTLFELNNENPILNIHLNEDKKLVINLFGELHQEYLKRIILERFDIVVDFQTISVNYYESINETIEGVGHYEPKGHYAEVHVLLEPASGKIIKNKCISDKTYFEQLKLIDYLEKNDVLGVNYNFKLNNIKITILSCKLSSSSKPSDSIHALKMAIRNGLKKANPCLLEPNYEYDIMVESSSLNEILIELDCLNSNYSVKNEMISIVKGELTGKKHHEFKLEFNKKYPNAKFDSKFLNYKIINDLPESNYNSETDTYNPTGSIFFKNGKSFYVTYDEVENYMHEPYFYKLLNTNIVTTNRYTVNDDELKRVMSKIMVSKPKVSYDRISNINEDVVSFVETKISKEKLIIIDGYNLLFSMELIKETFEIDFNMAKEKLMNILFSYQGLINQKMMVVFDAYKVDNDKRQIYNFNNIDVIYTKQHETADAFIESKVYELKDLYQITVVTNDNLIQMSIVNHNAYKCSIEVFEKDIMDIFKSHNLVK